MRQARWIIVIVSFLLGLLFCHQLFLSFPHKVSMVSRISIENKQLPNEIIDNNNVTVTTTAPLLNTVPTYAERLASSSFTEVEDSYYNRLSGVHVKCNNTLHVGRGGDGGWEVCMAPGFKPQKPCLVYSFGVNNIWEFDEIMARDYGCVVRAFDPSLKAKDHVHQPGPVNFYKLGLGGFDSGSSGWIILTFQSLLKKFNESDHMLDLVKIDIDYSEWDAFESMLKTGVLERTKQLLFETHTSDIKRVLPSKETFLRHHKILDGIESLGFRRFFRHDNPYGVRYVAATRRKTKDPVLRKSVNLRRTCCHELHYVNLKLVKNTAGLTPA